MDEAQAGATLDQLVAWGLIEERPDGEVAPTRRWVAKLQAAAEKLNQMVARNGGVPPEGNPLVLAVQQALANEGLTLDAELFERSVQMLVVLELSRMTHEKRAQYGFADAPF